MTDPNPASKPSEGLGRTPGDAISQDPDRQKPFGDHGANGIGPTEGMDADADAAAQTQDEAAREPGVLKPGEKGEGI